jgi:hypothetical protein
MLKKVQEVQYVKLLDYRLKQNIDRLTKAQAHS